MNRKHISDLARCLIIAVVLGSLLMLMIPISTVLADSVVTFPDPNLEGAIREAIGKPTGDIYESDLLVLTEFTADDLAIVDLTGLEYCTNLTTLSLEGNQTDNISPLSGLTNLTWLSLYGNQISDISPTENLTALTALGLGYNQISDISPLSGLTSLTELDLDGNQTDNISPLSGLTGLTRLALDDDEISDISPLSGLTSLTWLGLASNQTDNISPLSGLTSLQWLYLQNNQISDISPLSGLTSLQELLLNGNPIEDILPLAGLTGLTSLALVSNQIDDISPLSGLTNLTQLRLDDNLISDISPLSGLTSLTELGLEDNQVSNLAPLSNLTSLTRLYLSANQIINLSPLSNLINLSRLSLEYNQIINLSPLSGLTNLFEILLDYNQVSDLAPLSGLTGLWGLSLEYDQVSDIQPLVDNPGLASGDVVELRGNPLNADSVNDGIPALEARGVTVTWDGFASQRPNQPVNVQPADASPDVSLTPTLQSSAFSDPDGGDAHTASQWQITTVSGDYSSAVFDSDTDTSHRTSITTPLLDNSTTYYWRVAHQDNHGDWSNWSAETSFTTTATPNQVPNQPSNGSPANGATGLSLTPTLQSSAFSDPDGGDTHGASQWQITAVAGDYGSPVFDSLTDTTNLLSILVPSGKLSYSTTYYWHVRHQDNHGGWSNWSAETSFATMAAPNQVPNQPSNVSPANGATGLSLTPTLQSSAFSDPDAGDTHVASQWQITRTAGDYSSPILDSSTDTTHLIQITVSSGVLGGNSTYYWRVRYQDGHGDWSTWSAETSFTTLDRSPAQPTNVSPANGATGLGLTPTLQSSAFSDPDAGDTHAASQWQITRTAGDYSSPVFDSGADASNLTTIPTPEGALKHGTAYYWRVRYQDQHGTWSDWAQQTSFVTASGGQFPWWAWAAIGVAGIIVLFVLLRWFVLKRLWTEAESGSS